MTSEELDTREEERQKKVEDVTKQLVDLTNSYGSDISKGILSALNGSHRTLQQSFFRAMYSVIKQYGEDDWCDLRNQASKDFCREVTEKVEGYFPMV